jgi:hypothetical protein
VEVTSDLSMSVRGQGILAGASGRT